MGQLAFSKINKVALLLFSFAIFGQLKNNFTEIGQTFVDVAKFLQSLPVCVGVFDSFASC